MRFTECRPPGFTSTMRQPQRAPALLLLLGAAGFLFVVDRQVLGTLRGTLNAQFGITNSLYSLLLAAFMGPYTVAYLGSGRLVDRFGFGRMAWVCMIGMSGAVAIAGCARHVSQLFVAQVLLGLAQSAFMPTVLAAISNRFPEARRGTALALQSGIQNFGAIFASPLIASAALLWGWRGAYAAPAIAGLPLALGLAALSGSGSPSGSARRPVPMVRQWRDLMAERSFRRLVIARVCSDPFWFFLLYWQPAFLQSHLGLTLEGLGRLGWIPPLFSVGITLLLGLLCDRAIRRGRDAASVRLRCVGAITLIAPAALLLPLASTPSGCIALLAVLYALCSGWLALTNLLISNIVPQDSLGSAFGIVSACGAVSGIAFNLLAGPVIDLIGMAPILCLGAVMYPSAWFVLRGAKVPSARVSVAQKVAIVAIIFFSSRWAVVAQGARALGSVPSGVRMEWDGVTLIAGNELIERRWTLVGGLPSSQSLRTRSGEWLQGAAGPTTSVGPLTRLNAPRAVSWTVSTGAESPIEEVSTRGELRVVDAAGLGYAFHVKVFPGCPAVVSRIEIDRGKLGPPKPVVDESDIMDDFLLCRPAVAWRLVSLSDQTDKSEVFATEAPVKAGSGTPAVYSGTLFYGEPRQEGEGLLLVKHASPAEGRPSQYRGDLVATASSVRLVGNAVCESGLGYSWSVLEYSGGRVGRARALHSLQAHLHKQGPGAMISNTWGDRNRDARISESFVLAEIEAGSRLGVDVCQVDDGWQKGITRNSARGANGVWTTGFWASDPDFWIPAPQRFPRGLLPLSQAAQSRNMRIGLWFSPDGYQDYANWVRDADTIVSLYKKAGVREVKIDGMELSSRLSEERVGSLVDRVLRQTDGAVSFDLDITAGHRSGYFGLMQANLFLENRYTDRRNWWPHLTLRNLWTLAWYVQPQRLEIEFLNAERNRDSYGDNELAPARYPADYAFATTLVANPLAWFEVSSLPAAQFEAIGRLCAVWRQFRAELHRGDVVPIGGEPSGASWTGFCSITPETCQVLVFRENTQEDSSRMALPIDAGEWSVQKLAGEGQARMMGNTLNAEIPHKLHYLWLRLTRPVRGGHDDPSSHVPARK